MTTSQRAMIHMGMDLDYGFNAPENQFVWSTFAFGITLPAAIPEPVLELFYPHQEGTLRTHNSRGGSRRFALTHGINRLALPSDSEDLTHHFQLEPFRANPSDVRELGVILYPLRASLEGADLATALLGEPDDWTPLPQHNGAVAPALARHLLHSFVGPGFLTTYIQPEIEDGCPFLYLALYLPPAEQPGPTLPADLSINGIRHVLTLHRDAEILRRNMHPNLRGLRYEGKLELAAFRHPDGSLIDLDIFLAGPGGTERFPHQSTHWRGAGVGPIPPDAHIMRVAGPACAGFFLYSGATWYVKLASLYETLTGRPLAACGRILDWGIGCGRIARFFPATLHDRLIGADIDPFNIAWCREHLPAVQTHLTAPTPPLPFAPDTFDLVFGHSVITHLSEASQHEWLAELARITRPGGLCLLTVLGELSWFIRFFPAGRTPEKILELLESGFVDDGTLDVGVDTDHPGTYRNASHSAAYIRRVWSRHFEILHIIPAFADLQNLIVLRRDA